MHMALDRILPWTAYPLVVGFGIGLHLIMLQFGQSIALSTYVPVLLAAGMVTWLERNFPYDPAWQAQRADVKEDLWFMVIVQLVLPRALAFFFVVSLIEPLRSLDVPLSDYWPHHWPVWAQALLMLLAADFLRYWLHVWAHKNGFFWRFHAVHHSPPKLYWLNVGRFHPVDKGLQFLLDALPFILLGVDAPVIALYFVFYAVNGFFQHSNIKLRFGVLNYLISSAELHRWHHSRLAAESNNNYGNNLIIWDLLFGTWFLPRAREIHDIGLVNRRYPYSFLQQMRTPFVPRLHELDEQ